MKITEIKTAIESGRFDNSFSKLYHDIARQKNRYLQLMNNFLEMYGDEEAILLSVPGRTEISGNHTDHNHGMVLAASVNIDIIAVASKTDDNIVRIKSANYPEDVVDCSQLNPDTVRKGSSSAIVAGVCYAFGKAGLAFGGFHACTTSDVLTGSGLSSSAAFEVMCGKILSELYNDNHVSAIELAKFGQYAENVFFGKPCGLMDQAACACGGFLFIDFKNPEHPVTEKLQFDPEKEGYSFCIVNTGGNHADLTDDYASVPKEMHSCAALLGKKVLRDCNEEDFLNRISYMRGLVGDRAILRSIHFFDENKRVLAQKEALQTGDSKRFFDNVLASGRSSFMFLQNVYTNKNPFEQGLSLALAITEKYHAICRVHGGGFAGTIQAYVPTNLVKEYKNQINRIFGDNACMLLSIRPYGASRIYENQIQES